jgi:putative ABC transport system permease protein
LGADRHAIAGIVLREGALLAATGAIIGLGGALALSSALRSLLFEVTPTDPSTYVIIALLLAAIALLASWLPARRAASVDPLTALREG